MNRIRRFVAAVTAFAAVLLCSFYSRDVHPEDDGVYFDIDTLATNLNVPWQICFLPDATMLFTERTGAVRLYRNGKLSARPVLTVKDIRAETKTGLLGMAIHPDFNQNHWVYLAQNYAADNHLWLKIVQYQYAGDSLIKGKVLLQNIPAARNHTGCRLIFGMDKKLYLTSGDADQPALAQDLKALNGKILRINDDGSIPADNPFTKNDTARKEIWSYGHRNPQGLVFHPQSAVLYESEHGPTGGDEVNIIRKGKNYGWPVAHHRETREAMVGPLLEYTPSIGPSETIIYRGNAFPQLKGNLLVACLRGESILRIQLENGKIAKQEMLLKKAYGRIRSLVVGPDGYLYFSTSNFDMPESKGERPYDMVLRLRPAKAKNNQSITKIVANQPEKTEPANGKNLFKQLCASCHGENLQGTSTTYALTGKKFRHGAGRHAIMNSIANGYIDKGMPAWNGAVSKADIEKLADYIMSRSQ